VLGRKSVLLNEQWSKVNCFGVQINSYDASTLDALPAIEPRMLCFPGSHTTWVPRLLRGSCYCVVVGESTRTFQPPSGCLPHTVMYLAFTTCGFPFLSFVVI
jgi:hypothetical protein